jgi:hypothetical protein
MSEIVDLVRGMTAAGWKLFCAVAAIALGYYIVDRGRKAAAIEQAEESGDQAA